MLTSYNSTGNIYISFSNNTDRNKTLGKVMQLGSTTLHEINIIELCTRDLSVHTCSKGKCHQWS